MKFLYKGEYQVEFDQAMDALLEEHSLYIKDPISDFFETADVSKKTKKLPKKKREIQTFLSCLN